MRPRADAEGEADSYKESGSGARSVLHSCSYHASTGRVRLKPTITHVLQGMDKVPQAFEITANKGKYRAINPAQVMMRQ